MSSVKQKMRWFLPGFAFKRWVLLFLLGSSALALGLALVLNLQPITFLIDTLKTLAKIAPSHWSGPVLMGIGGIALMTGLAKARESVSSVIGNDGWVGDFMEQLYEHRRLKRGPKIVAIGGGTGLSTLLRGLKHFTSNITAIVTVGDDGGSSGLLRAEQGVIPPGDIRNCIAALSDEEQLMTELFQYRFKTGTGLGGHSFGNLFITAMSQVTGDVMSAIQASSKVLKIQGQVVPATLENITLVAELADGSVIEGESNIPKAGVPIAHLRCLPENPQPVAAALIAIAEADLIVMGPGSLYTSVIPNLLVKPIVTALLSAKAPKVYVGNIMSQPGETDGMSMSDHVRAILAHAQQPRLLDAVIVNETLPETVVAHYAQYGGTPVEVDTPILEAMGLQVIKSDFAQQDCNTNTARHDSYKVAETLMSWFTKRLVKTVANSHKTGELPLFFTQPEPLERYVAEKELMAVTPCKPKTPSTSVVSLVEEKKVTPTNTLNL
ncbi:MAG: YvcK family protein [Candidatus Melainabacteria bacterium]|nr:YvcK family protein [Candidatus Melainabacteria bacterium]